MDTTYFETRTPNTTKFDKHIFVNQAGYLPASEKRASLNTSATSFQIMDLTGHSCYEGKVTKFGKDKDSKDTIWFADFSDFQTPGIYRLVTNNDLSSLTFSISDDVYSKVFHQVSKAYYFLRCGCELTNTYAGPFTHGKCHDKPALLWEDKKTVLEVSGGWHDAGDYGRYVTAGACALAHLLYAYKMYPTAVKSLSLQIPESGSGVPDLLSECRIELTWLLKMQRSDGGVYHKATTRMHAPFVMPEKDTEMMYVFPVSSIATADFAAVCALASSLYVHYDTEFSDKLLKAAVLSGDWLQKNPDFLGFQNPKDCNTGDYSERSDIDNRFWAMAELYAATGEENYHNSLLSLYKSHFSRTDMGYHQIGGLGSLCYLLCGRKKEQSLVDDIEKHFLKKAKELAEASDHCGYGVAMTLFDYTWGSNQCMLKNGMVFAIADWITQKKSFHTYVERQIHYLLGVNATGYSYVSGAGEFCIKNPHLRPAFADGIEECIPGMVSGGPNGHPADPDACTLLPRFTPPMKCFVDDLGCYSLNEITIYWNSPAVFLFAYLANKV